MRSRISSIPAKAAKALGALLFMVVAMGLTLLLAEGGARLLDRGVKRQGNFCSWCRQADRARATRAAAAGPSGLAPAMPAARFDAPPPNAYRPQDLDVSQRNPAGYWLKDRPYLSVSPGMNQRSLLRTNEGQVIYDVRYGIDRFRRRTVPGQSGARDRFFMFLGCSLTFGEGVNDDETLPSQVSRLAAGHRVYNYGMHGYAPTDLMLRLKSTPIGPEIPESAGSAAYVYFDDHLARVLGPMSLVSTWGATKPYFAEVDGELRFLGSFETGRKRITDLYKQLWKTHLVHDFNIEMPPFMPSSHLRFFARLVAGMRDEIARSKKLESFHVVFLPGARSARLLVPYLEELGIRYVNYDDWDLARLTQERLHHPYDNHPTAAYHRLFAGFLAKDLGLAPR